MARKIEVVITELDQITAGSVAELERTMYKKMVDAGIPMAGPWRVTRGRMEQHEYPLNGCVVYIWTDEEEK